jgi:hypothetical protein
VTGFPSAYSRFNGVYDRFVELPYSNSGGRGSWEAAFVLRRPTDYNVIFSTRGTAVHHDGDGLLVAVQINKPFVLARGAFDITILLQDVFGLIGLSFAQILSSPLFNTIGYLGLLPDSRLLHKVAWDIDEFANTAEFRSNIFTPTYDVLFVSG